jgi:PhnB protein
MSKVKYKAPKGYNEAMAYLRIGNAAAAIDFYAAAFGARERYRLMMPDGRIGHAQLEFGETCVMLASEFPEMGIVGPKTLGGTTVTMALYVANADDVVDRAVKAGATLKRPVQDEFYGDRAGQVEDPFGHVWMIQTRLEDVSPKKMQKRLDQLFAQPPAGPPAAPTPTPTAKLSRPKSKK